MIRTSLPAGILSIATLLCAVQTAKADVYSVIITGKVVMADGTPPPFIASIERECTDFSQYIGPQTDKQGMWIWRLDIDVYEQRACVFRAHHDGYTSTEIDASNINSNYLDKTVHVADITLMPRVPDPWTIHTSGDNFPPKARAPFEKAIRALDALDMDGALVDFRVSVEVAPKFAEAWHALGVVYDKTGKPALARDAFTKAIAANPKLLPGYFTLAQTCIELKDWNCAAENSNRLVTLDVKRLYPGILLHQAVARFQLKDLAGAEQSANEMIRLDPKHKYPRAEWVLGRILEEKGDLDGARTHMMKYLQLEANPPDAELVQGHLQALGKPEAKDINPDLEVL